MLVFNEFELTHPEGFHEMTKDEKSGLSFWGGNEGVCISDPERHIVISFGAKTVGWLTGKLVKQDEILDRMETVLSKSMKDCGYVYDGSLQRNAGGKETEGFTYSYTAQNIGMTGESFVVKNGKTLIYFHYYTRTALKDENLPVWKEMLESIRWKEE